MTKLVIGLMMSCIAIGWVVAVSLLTGGASSLSHLPRNDGATVRITHIRVKPVGDAQSEAVVRLEIRNSEGEPLLGINPAHLDVFVADSKVAPDWWRDVGATRLRLTICVPSSVGVDGDRTAEGIREAVLGALDELDAKQDTSTVVAFDRKARVLHESDKPTAEYVRAIDKAMKSAKSNGRHQVGEAVSLALADSAKAKERESRVIVVITDSQDDNVRGQLEEFARMSRDAGVMLHVFGVGEAQANNALFGALAARCGGRYEFADSMRELQRRVRQALREIKGTYHLGFDSLKLAEDGEPVLVQTRVRTPSGTLEGAAFYLDTTNADWLVEGQRVEETFEPTPLSDVEWFFALGTLGVLAVSLAIPFVRLPQRSRNKKVDTAPSPKVAPEAPTIGPPTSVETPRPGSIDVRKEVDQPLPTPPRAGTTSDAPRRPPPIRRKDDLR